MMKQTNKILTLSAFAAAAAFSSASASVVVTNNTGTTTTVDDGTSTSTTLSNWSLGTGGNTVAVFFSGEDNGPLTATYGGQSMTVVEDTTGGRWSAAIAYLINPSVSTGDIVLNWSPDAGEIAYTPFALGGVGGVAASGAQDENVASWDFAYTTSLNDAYVLGVATNNDFNGPAPSVSGNPDLFEFDGSISGNFSTIHAHGSVATAGSYTDTYSKVSDNGFSTSTVVFEAVPEPSAFALLAGCFGLTWVMLRRR